MNLSDTPVIGLLAGIVLTLLLTSSNAAMGVLQTIAKEGLIDFQGLIPIMLGSNIGSAVIACIAVIGASIRAKRVVFIQVLYYVIGTGLFLLLQKPLIELSLSLGQAAPMNIELAIAYSLFQLLTGMVCILFVPLLLRITQSLIQTHQPSAEVMFGAQYLDKRFLATPSMALEQAQNETLRMGNIARETLMHASQYFLSRTVVLLI